MDAEAEAVDDADAVTRPMSLADAHPAVQEVDHALADLKERRSEFEARAAVLAEADAKAQQDYDQAVEDHLLRGGVLPSPPTLQLPDQAAEIRRQFMHEETQLREERRKALAEAYPDVLWEARSQAEELVRAARPTVKALADMMAEVGRLLGAVQQCRAAGNAWNGSVGPKQFHDRRLTVEEFVRLVATGGDPVGILDLTGTGQKARHPRPDRCTASQYDLGRHPAAAASVITGGQTVTTDDRKQPVAGILSADLLPWERQPEEGELAYQAFRAWLDSDKRRVTDHGPTAKNWSMRHQWSYRAHEYDVYMARVDLEDQVRYRRRMNARHRQIGSVAQSKVVMWLNQLTDDKIAAMSPADATRLLDVAVRIERAATPAAVGDVDLSDPYSEPPENGLGSVLPRPGWMWICPSWHG